MACSQTALPIVAHALGFELFKLESLSDCCVG